MNDRAAGRAASRKVTPKNCAASCGGFIIPPERDNRALDFLVSG
jgi:hypothetical protein